MADLEPDDVRGDLIKRPVARPVDEEREQPGRVLRVQLLEFFVSHGQELPFSFV